MKWIGQDIYDLEARFRSKVDFAKDVTFYQPFNNADPKISIGASDTEKLQISVLYQGNASQTAQIALFQTFTESDTAHDGRFHFTVDGDAILKIQDGGIDFRAGKGIGINGVDILTDNGSGVATLSNIDALDATTIATFETAMEANLDTFGSQMTSATSLASIGTITTGVWNGTDIGVAHGGTGASTLSTGAVLVGNGTGSLVPSTFMQYFNDGAESNTSTLSIFSNQDTGDKFTIATTTHGATTLTTIDDDAAAAHFEIAADGDITLDAAGQIYFEAVTSRFVSSDANDPLVIIQGEADDDTGPRLRFNKKRGADGEDGDSCGILQWQSFDDGTPSTQLYGQIETTIHDATAGEESGKMELGVANEDGGMGTGLMLQGGSADNEVDVTIGLGASSVTTVAGSITMSGSGSPVAAMTNAGLLSVANQSNITGLGTISSGVWNGTAIASAYLDADTAHLSGAQTFTGTKTLNSFKGTAGATVTNILDEDAMGSDSATALATQQSIKAYIDAKKQVMHYQVQGYSAGSTNYVAAKVITDIRAPFLHSVDIGSDGLDAQTIQVWMRTGGHTMPNACTLKRFTGWTAAAGSASQTVALFRVRLQDDVDSDPEAVLLQEVTYTASGNATANFFNVTTASSGDAGDLVLAAGDIVFSALKGGSNPVYFNGTFEVEF